MSKKELEDCEDLPTLYLEIAVQMRTGTNYCRQMVVNLLKIFKKECSLQEQPYQNISAFGSLLIKGTIWKIQFWKNTILSVFSVIDKCFYNWISILRPQKRDMSKMELKTCIIKLHNKLTSDFWYLKHVLI